MSSSVKWQSDLVYPEYIIVLSETIEQHLNHVQCVLTVPKDTGVTFKLKKCSFFAENINHLGHVICPGKIEVVESTTDAIRQIRDPSTQTGIRVILRLFGVFRQLVISFLHVVALLNQKFCKPQPKPFPSLTFEE